AAPRLLTTAGARRDHPGAVATDPNGWSHATGETVVPSRWRATAICSVTQVGARVVGRAPPAPLHGHDVRRPIPVGPGPPRGARGCDRHGHGAPSPGGPSDREASRETMRWPVRTRSRR